MGPPGWAVGRAMEVLSISSSFLHFSKFSTEFILLKVTCDYLAQLETQAFFVPFLLCQSLVITSDSRERGSLSVMKFYLFI